MSKGPLIDRATALEAFEDFKNTAEEAGLDKNEIYLGGSLRRGLMQVHDVDVLMCHQTVEEFILIQDFLEPLFGTMKSEEGAARSGLFCHTNFDITITAQKCFGAAYLHCTGSMDFNVYCRFLAQQKGWKLNQYFLMDAKQNIVCDCVDEASILKALGFHTWVEPSLRSDSKDYSFT